MILGNRFFEGYPQGHLLVSTNVVVFKELHQPLDAGHETDRNNALVHGVVYCNLVLVSLVLWRHNSSISSKIHRKTCLRDKLKGFEGTFKHTDTMRNSQSVGLGDKRTSDRYRLTHAKSS